MFACYTRTGIIMTYCCLDEHGKKRVGRCCESSVVGVWFRDTVQSIRFREALPIVRRVLKDLRRFGKSFSALLFEN